jgi:hypothetical protein
MKPLIIFICAVVFCAAGCAEVQIIPFEEDPAGIELLKKMKPPLSLRVAVAPVTRVFALGQKEVTSFPMEPDLSAIRSAFVRRLQNYQVFRVLEPVEQPEGTEGLAPLFEAAWKESYDILITLELTRYEVLYNGTNVNYLPNFFLTLAGLVPSYFVRDEVYAVETALKATVYSVDSEKILYKKTYAGRAERDLDDFERGWMFFGYYSVPGSLGLENWKKISAAVSPFAMRNLELSYTDDFLTDFRRVAESPAWAENAKKTLALVIGVREYQSASIAENLVNYSDKDAEEFAEFLKSKKGGLLPKHVMLLTNESAKRKRILDELLDFLGNRLKTYDRAVIYFAGYGATDEYGASYIIAYDTNPKNLGTSAIPFDAIAEALLKIRATQATIFLDTSFDAPLTERALFRNRAPMPGAFIRLASRAGVAVMTASAQTEGAIELSENKHGVFTFYLLAALAGAADADKDGVITARELFTNVSEKVSVEASMEGAVQNPQWYEPDGKKPSDERNEGFSASTK